MPVEGKWYRAVNTPVGRGPGTESNIAVNYKKNIIDLIYTVCNYTIICQSMCGLMGIIAGLLIQAIIPRESSVIIIYHVCIAMG